jgi:hypothetical protein
LDTCCAHVAGSLLARLERFLGPPALCNQPGIDAKKFANRSDIVHLAALDHAVPLHIVDAAQ